MEHTRAGAAPDLEAVVALAAEGRELIRDARGGALWLARQAPPEPVEATYRAALHADGGLVQLGLIDDVPLGLLYAEVEIIDDVAVAVVRELFVTPDARGVGIGEAMMDATIEWARTRGCIGVDGYALPGDRATKNFFETFGLVARGIVVHRRIVE